MILIRFFATATALGLSAGALRAQDRNAVPQLQRQLQQLQDNFEKIQAQQRQEIDSLRKQIEALQRAAPTSAPPATLSAALPAAAPPTNHLAPSSVQPKPPWSPTAPITLFGNQKNYLNLSFDGLFAAGGSTASDLDRLQLGGHDPQQRGFTVQSLETVFEGAVDPYFRARANFVATLDTGGESNFEVEEAFAETTSLPWNLQLRAGHYQTEFGRLNPTHPHAWAFVDVPLVNGRFFGPDGLRNPGARASWLMPTRFYSELFLSVQNSQGETAHSFLSDHDGDFLFGRPGGDRSVSSFGDLLFTPRYAASFELSDTHTALVGTSAAFGPNGSGADTQTQIYGLDLFWKWKPRRSHGGFPFVSWQTEALWRRYSAGAYDGSDSRQPLPLPAEMLTDYGCYSQLAWGFKKGWVAALRGDWVSGDRGAFYPDPDRDTRWRIAPNLTWYPTEYSKVRLQYNYDQRRNIGTDHSVWLQFEFLLGAHAAHKF